MNFMKIDEINYYIKHLIILALGKVSYFDIEELAEIYFKCDWNCDFAVSDV